ncbi:MAG: septum formation inhibitor Maf [Oscillospiraceae bacterium]|nr:septum formation inhibitor Maf [Oscillospiraceae bacterium]
MYILASGSPRRKELLSLIIPEYEVLVSGCEEFVSKGTPAEKVPAILAEQKALAVAKLRPDDTVIGSDTVVVLGGEIFGKPKDKDHAHAMLRALSGKKHFVYTGVAVAEKGEVRSFVQKTEVEFYELSDETIDRYIETGEPMDKAGAYGIQGKGSVLVKGISGDYFNVMGLPVAETARFLGIIK